MRFHSWNNQWRMSLVEHPWAVETVLGIVVQSEPQETSNIYERNPYIISVQHQQRQ